MSYNPDLPYDVDRRLLEIKQNLSGYRKQGDEEASEIVNLQR